MSNDLMTRMMKAGSKSVESSILSDSMFFTGRSSVPTSLPALNLALSGSIRGGLSSGLTILAGPSKHFKTNIALVMVSAYMRAYDDAVCLFFDSEFGSTDSYFRSAGIDTSRVLHTPVENIEQLKFDLVKTLETVKRGDRVIVFVDSIGNLASKKEIEDALNEKSVADMTRAKALKGLFRMVTPSFVMKDIPSVCVAHTYDSMDLYPQKIVSGGTGLIYSANTVLTIGKQKIRDENKIAGYDFILNAAKSRFIREESKIPLEVRYDGGISAFSGMLGLARDMDFIRMPSKGWYVRVMHDPKSGELIEDKKWQKSQMDTKFWVEMFSNSNFESALEDRFKLPTAELAPDQLSISASGLEALSE